MLVSDIQSDDVFRLSSEDRQSMEKKKIKKETMAVWKSREQLYMIMFWLIPGAKVEPRGVLEEVVPRKDTEIFREPQWRLQSHFIITQDELQWLVNDSDRFTLRCKWFLTRVTKDIKANELDHVITTWQNHLHSSNSSYSIRRRGLSNSVHPLQNKRCHFLSDYLYMALKDRPMISRRISLVPAPISYSFASRRNRPMG